MEYIEISAEELNEYLERLEEENETLNHFVEANKMALRQLTVYEWREIGETEWSLCNEEWFAACQSSPNCDTRKRLLSIEEVKTNAFKQGFDACINASVKMGMIDEDGEFANQLRQQVKGE
jgi:hypothetical protein